MWNLDDPEYYFKLLAAVIPHMHTWGALDRKKREDIRGAVAPLFPRSIPSARWWAFRLYGRKRGSSWNIENIPKLIIDAFSKEQLQKDGSLYPHVGLYARDTIENVRMIQVGGEPWTGEDSLKIEIFGAT